jgi:general secretion pathway protein F
VAVFEYEGITQAGKAVKGVRDADNPRGLRAALAKDGILLTSATPAEEAAEKRRGEVDFKRMFRRVSQLDVAVSTRQLATLTRAGIPLVQALNALIDQTQQPELKTCFTSVKEKVNEGTSFADALREHPRYFNDLYVNMVHAGEQAGNLEQVLERLADFTEQQVKLRNKVVAAMAYPGFMMLVGSLMVWIMLVVVVPKVMHIFESFDQVLPWYTRLLIVVSTFLQGYWWLLLLLMVAGGWLLNRWRQTPKGRARWDAFTLRVPLFGTLARMVAISRFARTLSTLLTSGVPIMRAMDITKHVLGNVQLMQVVEEARLSIQEGESIAEPLKRSGKFDPIVTHMIAIGEKSGQLEEMLLIVANAYDDQVDARVSTLTALLEPVMILSMGSASGAIIFAILSPLMRMNQFVQ